MLCTMVPEGKVAVQLMVTTRQQARGRGSWQEGGRQDTGLPVHWTSDTGCPGAVVNMDMQPDCIRGEVWASAAEEATPPRWPDWPARSRLDGQLLLPDALPAGLLVSCGTITLPSGFRVLLLLPQLHHLALLGLFIVASVSLSPFDLKDIDSGRWLPAGGLLSGSETSAWLGRRPLNDLPGVVMERSACSWVGLGFLLLKKLRRLPLG